MTKQEFINQLKNELQGLPITEVDDIVRDQEEFIREAIAAGRSEDAVIASLGSPQELGRNIKAEIKIEKAQDEKKLTTKFKGVLGAVGALLVLAPFNLIFVLGPFLGVLGTLLGGWAAAAAICTVFVALLVLFFTQFASLAGDGLIILSTFFGFLGGIALGCFLLGVMYFVSLFVLKMTLKYLKWNLNFIKKQVQLN